MVDHPLVSQELRTYIQKNKIEELLNQGLNIVMQQLPQDPYSVLASTLIESQNKPPIIEKVCASETSFGTPSMPTISIDVYVKYQLGAFKANTYVFPYSQEESESEDFLFDHSDDKDKKTMEGICTFINTKLSDFVKGKELPLSKSAIQTVSAWAARTKAKAGQDSLPMNYSPFGVKAVFEALQASYGKIKSPEAPALALYEHQTLKKIPQDGNPTPPKLMFTLFNGGKANASKVKFVKFYLIMQYEMEDLDNGKDALQIYYKVAASIKNILKSHKLGENGFKPNASGSYFNAHENHNETFKLIEDAIN